MGSQTENMGLESGGRREVEGEAQEGLPEQVTRGGPAEGEGWTFRACQVVAAAESVWSVPAKRKREYFLYVSLCPRVGRQEDR